MAQHLNHLPISSSSSGPSSSPNLARANVPYPPSASYSHPAYSMDPYAPASPATYGNSSFALSHPSGNGVYGAPPGSAPPYHPGSPRHSNESGSEGLGDTQADPPAGRGTTAAEKKALVLKSRSTVACVLCRKQKMKCEGPEKAPCRRCRVAGVECTFESAPQSAPRVRGTGVSEAWVEQRIYSVEERVATLEVKSHTPDDSRCLTATRGGPATASDHERRIAQLEAQLYALQFGNHPPPPPQHHHFEGPPPNFAYGPPPPGMRSSHLPPGPYPPLAPPPRFGPDGGKREEHGGMTGDAKRRALAGPDARRPDFIERGEVSEDEAIMCFESYFLNFVAQPPPSSLQPQPVSGGIRTIHLDFNETRIESPLLLATLVFIGARSLNHAETCHASLNEAIQLCHTTFLPNEEAGEGPTETDLKAIILLGLYNGFPDLMAHGVALAYKFELPSALLRYEKLSNEAKVTREGRELINKGRTFIVSYLFTAYYSICRGQHGAYTVPKEVLSHQFDILEQSEASQQPTDRLLRVSAEECFILHDVYNELGQGMRIEAPSFDEKCEIVGAAIVRLQKWLKEWVDMMELLSAWGDSAELKTAVPFHHGRMSLLTWIFRNVPEDSESHRSGRLRELAQMGSESALTILRFGVESRIWLPHSMVALYLHHVNIPSALNMLCATSRLFPEDANFVVIRTLLHRLLKQCDAQLFAATGSARELARAQKTKMFVLDFDRYAFEASGIETQCEEPREEPLFGGDDISASLGAMRQELGLWGSILMNSYP